jgi:hypothetical protein
MCVTAATRFGLYFKSSLSRNSASVPESQCYVLILDEHTNEMKDIIFDKFAMDQTLTCCTHVALPAPIQFHENYSKFPVSF